LLESDVRDKDKVIFKDISKAKRMCRKHAIQYNKKRQASLFLLHYIILIQS